MEIIKATALRDFAIQHLPRAQKVSPSMPAHQYQLTLYGVTALISPTAPAIQQAAATLLRSTLTLLIEWDDDGRLTPAQRHATEQQAIQDATELCTLTGHTIPWLPALSALPEPTPASPPAPPPQQPAPTVPPLPLLQPGETQTTKVAAKYLGVTEQTMRSWVSNDNGPLVPVKQGTRNGWPTAELVRLKRDGWESRSRKKP